MGEDLIYKMVGFLESASPLLWEAGMRQVYSSMVINYLWFGFLAVVGIVSGVMTVRFNRKWEAADRWKEDGYGFLTGACFVLTVVPTIVGAVVLTTAIQRTLNPIYYAIQYLLALIPAGS